jgi:hypothetical protein
MSLGEKKERGEGFALRRKGRLGRVFDKGKGILCS